MSASKADSGISGRRAEGSLDIYAPPAVPFSLNLFGLGSVGGAIRRRSCPVRYVLLPHRSDIIMIDCADG